jgi:hypothetical protein
MKAGKPTYSVERVAPEGVRDELCRLWGDNLHVEGGVDRKFDWLYVDAPQRPDSVFLLAAEQDGARRWVGTAGVGLRALRVLGRDLRAGLLADLAVDRDHRSVMPALALVRAVKAWTIGEGGIADVAYGFPNQHAEGVFKRVGYHPLGTIGRWARVLRHASYASRVKDAELRRVPAALRRVVDRAAEVPAIAAVAGGAVDMVRLAAIAPTAVQAARRIKLAWCEHADERIDQIWEAAKDEHDVCGVRTSRFLRWRFPASERLSIAIATARGDGAPQAYAVVEDVDGVAHLRDLFGLREAVGWLLDLLVPALYPRGIVSLSVRYLGAPWLVEALESRGFVARHSERLITVGVTDRLDAEARAALTTAARWHLTDADEDT